MADEFDVKEFLENNRVNIRDYDSFLRELQEETPTFIGGQLAGGFGVYYTDAATISEEDQWEIIKSLAIQQQRISPYSEYLKGLTDDLRKQKLQELVGYGIPDLDDVVSELLPQNLQNEFTSYVIQMSTVDQNKILDDAPGAEIIRKLLKDQGLEGLDFEKLPAELKQSLLNIVNASSNIPGAAAYAQYYGFSQEEAVFNFNYTGTSTNPGPVYKQGMASSLLASMSESEVGKLQSKLIESGYLSPFTAYTLFDPSDAATQIALAKAMASHNNRVGATPTLDRNQQYELLSGLVSPDTTKLILNKLNSELDNDISTLGEEERTRLYGVNELTLAAATERADTIAGQVLSRDIDMVTASKLAEVYTNIYNEKYQEVVKTALDKMATGRSAELQRIKDIQAGKQVEDTRFVGLPASSEIESTVPSTEEMAQQAATFAKLDFSRRLKDTYFAQEIDDNERRAAIAQSSIGFNTALRTLGGG